MKIIALLFLLGFTTPEINSSEVERVQLKGVVLEELTGEPIAGATVKVESLNMEVFTDFDGNFTIDNVLPGNYSVEVSFVSFESKEIKDMKLESGSDLLQVKLK